ncbi:GTP cyclohydrolase I FolE [Methylobacterium nodulans]|uniref:GTP cyclohydrolase 1 n=1 Tax=Methylobacterium nodulans (strain LMG 21967 / CNCM I-2342 / ORS 2060) TaxID=460265 RepID=B8IWN6_METNO|nr:GTP cyclohydrolase I [Methylobacterium nodulans ORS 2060]
MGNIDTTAKIAAGAILQRREAMAASVRSLLVCVGEDVDREGLRDTPARVARMYEEVFSGLNEDPVLHLKTQFCDDGHEEIVVVRDIEFYSMCEHHLVPFFGKAHVAYVPQGGRLTGLSKIARCVQTIARRPQLQERLTSQIVAALEEALTPLGAMALVEAEHLCMAMRGVRSSHSFTRTLVASGCLKTDPEQRAEAFQMLKG